MERESKTGWRHLSSARRSRVLASSDLFPHFRLQDLLLGLPLGAGPGPGSSEAIRLMAAWSSVKSETFSGVIHHLAVVSSALAMAVLPTAGLLVVAHVGFDTHPEPTILPCDRVSGRSAVQSRPVREHGERALPQPWPQPCCGALAGTPFRFLCLIILACSPSRLWWRTFARISRPLSVQWRHVASAPLPSAQAFPRKM